MKEIFSSNCEAANCNIGNYDEIYLKIHTYNVRKDVPRSKELTVADWNTSTAVRLRFLVSQTRRNHYVQTMHSCLDRFLAF